MHLALSINSPFRALHVEFNNVANVGPQCRLIEWCRTSTLFPQDSCVTKTKTNCRTVDAKCDEI